jgi:hypothetical protein
MRRMVMPIRKERRRFLPRCERWGLRAAIVMNQGLRRWVVYTGIFALGVALYVVMVLIGVAFGLSSDVARLLAFGGLAVYSLTVAIVVFARR